MIIEEIQRAKKKVFDKSLWLEENSSMRRTYSYKETKDWKQKMRGVETYPVCPFCGIGVGEPNKDFNRGLFCDKDCERAWEIKYFPAYIKDFIKNKITQSKIGKFGDGI